MGMIMVYKPTSMNFIFPFLEIIIPTDELIFFRGVGVPPTSRKRKHIQLEKKRLIRG